MNPHAKLITTLSLFLGTTITISSNHWVMAWTGLEINTLAIIPLISKSHHPRAIEAAIKYFLVQAAASALVLFSSMTNAWYTGQWDLTQLTHPTSCLLLTAAIAMKLGLVPFHFWFPEVLQGSSLTTALLLSTVMKFPPITILFMTSHSLNPTLLTTMALASAALGGWMGLNQTQIRKILAFSSISHLGWMAIIIVYNPKLTLLTFYLYSLMTTTVFITLNTTKTMTLSTMMISWTKTPMLNATLMLTLLSLAGLPPLTGFLPKWLTIQELTKQEMTTVATVISMLSLLGLFFYLRLAYYSTITLPPNSTNHMKQWHINKSTNVLTAIVASLSILLLPLSPMILTTI
uniref:NADH-ubiquinone oxidoreductase chain 2 n=1 Tax=Stercorarius maccormicki TaxID=395889 RepID=A0A0U1XYH4_STEMC|nr:NADH dehydrogenase subunit 2 [Stercorarius maccormicki]YP_010691198.1 NADH dehydrogenase subunit 2 [Stercorarius lonnbergi]YP_010691224.1 NADH dehydrogenase subunit 2 [Stercorarius chilensis]AJA05092.1 NADH dehydrogenase subunit 2 [Stercorarius maccormicki]UQV81439.1 NADH dehydrogenase subunit 2 [Stercorarius maccormicki]WBU93325.1 NADH dehydrogenase subunit 2 [Stercorarius lonnbergi]WBU93351.1 NADH dehydrogenase subunit 2 [Stercorarius maccormicki]WBU93390.1 NADH dehydrogenase subunit 2 